ncbi:MAG: T9SS type A sorting domain-containing protein, partial [Prevotella sp.]|nr:T9SS type A sorting domain-containing protein [Prevotella sp.]
LNDHFVYDFGSYTSGSTYYNIPALEPGPHKLKFRAWDILNNSATTELAFTVVKGLEPDFSVGLTNNPAKENTTFIINHDRTGSDMEVEIEVFDMSGRRLWLHRETGVSTSSAYTVGWNLTLDNGQRLQTGVYLYRVRISSDGSKKVSRSKKLIVLGG